MYVSRKEKQLSSYNIFLFVHDKSWWKRYLWLKQLKCVTLESDQTYGISEKKIVLDFKAVVIRVIQRIFRFLSIEVNDLETR